MSTPDAASDTDGPPTWLALPLAAALGLLVGAIIVGVATAVVGLFTPLLVAAGTVVVGVPCAVIAARAVERAPSSRSTHLVGLAVLGLTVAVTLVNSTHHGQHLVADRDPGVYLTTARHLMDAGDVLVPGPVGPFVDAPGVSPNGAGFSPIRGDGTLEPQFPHLTAVLLAMGGWVAEIGLFLVTPALAGLGLLCLYAWATTVVGSRWAGVAAAVTAVSMPFTVFARDTYSEPVTMVLVFGGLWLLHLAERTQRRPVWLVAGLVVGATNMARVDAYLYLAPLALAVAVSVRLTADDRRRAQARCAGWFAVGLVATTALGLWDTATLTGGYFDDSLGGGRLAAMAVLATVSGLVGWFGAGALWRPHAGRHASATLEPTSLLRTGLTAAAAALLGFFAWAWWIRPDPDGLPTIAVEGVNVLSYLPQAATISLRWLGWYLGPLPLALGLIGMLWLVVGLARPGRPAPAEVAGLGAVLVTLLLYLWSPNITPDHPWAMRRFAAVALPGVAVGISAAARALWAQRDAARPSDPSSARPRAAARAWLMGGLAVAVAVGSVASAAVITWPTRTARAQVPMRQRMHEICDLLEPDDAVLVPIDGILAVMMSVPVGVWCDVPSAGGTARLDVGDVARLAVDWQAEGRRLVVLSSSGTPVFATLHDSGLVAETIDLAPMYPRAIEPTITSRPDEVVADGRLGKDPDGGVTFRLFILDLRAARRLAR